jgi:hypothetical protein
MKKLNYLELSIYPFGSRKFEELKVTDKKDLKAELISRSKKKENDNLENEIAN